MRAPGVVAHRDRIAAFGVLHEAASEIRTTNQLVLTSDRVARELHCIADKRVLDTAGARIVSADQRVISAARVTRHGVGVANKAVEHDANHGIVAAIEPVVPADGIAEQRVNVTDDAVERHAAGAVMSMKDLTKLFSDGDIDRPITEDRKAGRGSVSGQGGVAVKIAVERSDVAVAVVSAGIGDAIEGAEIAISVGCSSIKYAVEGANVLQPVVRARVPSAIECASVLVSGRRSGSQAIERAVGIKVEVVLKNRGA